MRVQCQGGYRGRSKPTPAWVDTDRLRQFRETEPTCIGCRAAFEGIGVLARAGHAIALEAVKAPLKEAIQ